MFENGQNILLFVGYHTTRTARTLQIIVPTIHYIRVSQNALQIHKRLQCLAAYFYHWGHEGKAKKLVKDLSYTSLPEAINWGLEQLPNITVQINHSLTRRLTYFLCIKCPLIKLPIWQNPKRQILGSPLMVICSSWATAQPMWCVPSLWQEERTEFAAGLSSPLGLRLNADLGLYQTAGEMIIKPDLRSQAWKWSSFWQTRGLIRVTVRLKHLDFKKQAKHAASHCPGGNEAAVTDVCNPAGTELKHRLLWPFLGLWNKLSWGLLFTRTECHSIDNKKQTTKGLGWIVK